VRQLLFSALIIFLFVGSVQAGSMTNFPDDHWVYDAIDALAGSSVMDEIVPEEINRFEAALLVSQAIQQLELLDEDRHQRLGVSRDVTLSDIVLEYNRTVSEKDRVDNTEADWLNKLALEFRPELEALGYSVQDQSSKRDLGSGLDASGGLGYDPVLRENLRRPYLASDGSELYRSSAAKPGSSEQDFRVIDAGRVPDLNLWNQPSSAHSSDEERQVPLAGTAFQFDGEVAPVGGLQEFDERISLANDLRVGARYIEGPDTDDEEKQRALAGISGQYFLSEDLSLEGEYLQSTETAFGGGALSLGATMRLGDQIELGGSVRSLQSGFQPLGAQESLEGGSGYGLSLRLGDLILNTMRDEHRFPDSEKPQITTSVDLQYNLPNSMLLSAGFRQTDEDFRSVKDLGKPSMTSLELDIPIPQGRLQLGLASEWTSGGDGENSGDMWQAGLSDGDRESFSRTTASVGFSYLLDADTSFKLNYRLIDFSGMDTDGDEDSKSNRTTAEFSIRF